MCIHKAGETPMTDYQIVKVCFEAGKTQEEILAVIAALKHMPKDEG